MEESDLINDKKYRVLYDFDFHEPVSVANSQRVQMRVYYDNLKEFKESLGRQNPRLPELNEELMRVRKWIKKYSA